MKKILIFTVMILAGLYRSESQTVLFHQQVKDYSVPPDNGPGLKSYSVMFVGLGLILPVSDTTAAIRIPASFYYNIGVRTKKKLTHWLSLGSDFTFAYESFSIRQEEGKMFPDTVLHKKQSVSFYGISLGPYVRITYGRHGNYLGKFVDAGVHIKCPYIGATQYSKDINDDMKTKVNIKGLKYYNIFNFSPYVRLGFNRYSFTASYRLLSMFKEEYYKKELPPLMVGFDITFN